MNKLFIIGLPRTGTTSISVALLEHDFMVAHTAFTKHAFELADVISDAPCFSDYKELDKLFPGSKFVYLDRNLEQWIPSAQMLLNKMSARLDPITGVFSPVLKRSFNEIFELTTTDDPVSTQHLTDCYLNHQQAVFEYFKNRTDFLSINISHTDSLPKLLDFLGKDIKENKEFPHLNMGRHVAGWKEFKHANKVNANSAGLERRKFFDYK
jgi:hypothetical protein